MTMIAPKTITTKSQSKKHVHVIPFVSGGNNYGISNFIHFYIGQEVSCVIGPGHSPGAVVGINGILVGVTKSDVERDRHIAIIDFEGEQFNEYYVEKVFPRLRLLSDLKDTEANEIGKMWLGSNGSVKYRVKHNERYCEIYLKYGGSKRLVIDYDSGDMDFYEGDELDVSLSQGEIFRYLISRGFDVFGLIGKKMAIDKAMPLLGY